MQYFLHSLIRNNTHGLCPSCLSLLATLGMTALPPPLALYYECIKRCDSDFLACVYVNPTVQIGLSPLLDERARFGPQLRQNHDEHALYASFMSNYAAITDRVDPRECCLANPAPRTICVACEERGVAAVDCPIADRQQLLRGNGCCSADANKIAWCYDWSDTRGFRMLEGFGVNFLRFFRAITFAGHQQ